MNELGVTSVSIWLFCLHLFDQQFFPRAWIRFRVGGGAGPALRSGLAGPACDNGPTDQRTLEGTGGAKLLRQSFFQTKCHWHNRLEIHKIAIATAGLVA